MKRRPSTLTSSATAVLIVALLLISGLGMALPDDLTRPSNLDDVLGGMVTEDEVVDPTARVPPSARPWLLRAHEQGRPYPPELLETLAPLSNDEVVSVIVQFRFGTDPEDEALLDRLGIELVYRFVGVDACHVRGRVDAVWRLVDSGRAWYVEPDSPIIHDMEVGTRVINATRVWAAEVQQRLASTNVRIDGRGVTAVVVDTGIDASHPDLDYKTTRPRHYST
jgi:hypothetical protein